MHAYGFNEVVPHPISSKAHGKVSPVSDRTFLLSILTFKVVPFMWEKETVTDDPTTSITFIRVVIAGDTNSFYV